MLSGHTDGVGDDLYNLGLSLRRAASVGHWLVTHGYVGPKNVMWFGLGKTKPIASNHDEGGRAKNRRVEIRILAGADCLAGRPSGLNRTHRGSAV